MGKGEYTKMVKGLRKRRVATNKGKNAEYIKYHGVDSHLFHEEVATDDFADGSTMVNYDPETATLANYSMAVKQGHGKDYFFHGGNGYRITNSSGTAREQLENV